MASGLPSRTPRLWPAPHPTPCGSGFFIDQDQSALTGAEHHPPMAGIDWTQALGIATLVLSLAVICFIAFSL
jgi:hypothetical protein